MLTHAILFMGSDFLVGLGGNVVLAIARAAITYINEDYLTFQ